MQTYGIRIYSPDPVFYHPVLEHRKAEPHGGTQKGLSGVKKMGTY